MKLESSAQRPPDVAADALLVPLWQKKTVPRSLQGLDRALDGTLGRLLEQRDFGGSRGEVCLIPSPQLASPRLGLLGLGEEKNVDAEALRRVSAAAVRILMKRKLGRGALLVPPVRRIPQAEVGQALAEGAILGSYRFDRYRTAEDLPRAPDRLTLIAADARSGAALRLGIRLGTILAESTNLARDLSNEPGSVHTPAWLAARARALGREARLRVRVLGPRELEREKMGGILAVGRGSEHPPRLIVLEYGSPGARRRPTVALVGKGITFDTGGISLKPAASMPEMKHDMSGGAAVFGAVRAAALLRLPLHIVGIVAAAENKPGGRAYLPGDVIQTAAGKTIEVLNTDAEGRIVLADALHYAQRFKPSAIVDLATLTGSCLVALGSHCSGLLGNDEGLLRRVREAGDRTHERVWPLPLWDEYKEQIKSQIADLKNTGGREGGTILAGAFLSHFVGDHPWAHLDIAGTAITNKELPYSLPGATGVGVRLLVDLLRHWRKGR
jgi:leucyl aminopeptidase